MYLKNDCRILDEIFPMTITKTPMTRQKHPPDFHHWHNFYEISCIIKGSAICHVSDQYYKISEGDIIIFNDSEIHGWDIQEDLLLLVLNFSGEIISPGYSPLNAFDTEYLNAFIKKGSNFQNVLYKYNRFTQDIHQLMQNIYFEYTHDYQGKFLMIKADMLKLLTILYRNFLCNPTDKLLLSERRENLIELENVLSYINTNYTEKITLEQMASKAHMSPCYFSTFFHKITGESFKSYITRLRLQKAHKMILSNRQTITTIACECGFSNMANFYKLYVKQFGHTPGESRK